MFLTKEIENFLEFKNNTLGLNLKIQDCRFATNLILTYLWEIKEVKTFEEYKREITEFYNTSGFYSNESPILTFLLTHKETFQETKTGRLFRSSFCSVNHCLLKSVAFILTDAEVVWSLTKHLFLKERRNDDDIFREILEKRRGNDMNFS